MTAGGFALAGFVVAALAAGAVAFLKGRPVLASLGPASIVVGVAMVAIGRWRAGREEDGLAALGFALGYGMLVVVICGGLLVAAVVGALLPARPASWWLARRTRDPL